MMTGRPPIYKTVEELMPKIEDWMRRVLSGEERATVTGLCMALDFDSKDTLYNYRDNPEFSYPIKKALLLVENGYEGGLWTNSPTGPIFALKNMGWKDKREQEHSGELKVSKIEVELVKSPHTDK